MKASTTLIFRPSSGQTTVQGPGTTIVGYGDDPVAATADVLRALFNAHVEAYGGGAAARKHMASAWAMAFKEPPSA